MVHLKTVSFTVNEGVLSLSAMQRIQSQIIVFFPTFITSNEKRQCNELYDTLTFIQLCFILLLHLLHKKNKCTDGKLPISVETQQSTSNCIVLVST